MLSIYQLQADPKIIFLSSELVNKRDRLQSSRLLRSLETVKTSNNSAIKLTNGIIARRI